MKDEAVFFLFVRSQGFHRGKRAVTIWFRTGNVELSRGGFLTEWFCSILLLELLRCTFGFRDTFSSPTHCCAMVMKPKASAEQNTAVLAGIFSLVALIAYVYA